MKRISLLSNMLFYRYVLGILLGDQCMSSPAMLVVAAGNIISPAWKEYSSVS